MAEPITPTNRVEIVLVYFFKLYNNARLMLLGRIVAISTSLALTSLLSLLATLFSSSKLFSSKLITGTRIKKYAKYITVEIAPNSIKGDSTELQLLTCL